MLTKYWCTRFLLPCRFEIVCREWQSKRKYLFLQNRFECQCRDLSAAGTRGGFCYKTACECRFRIFQGRCWSWCRDIDHRCKLLPSGGICVQCKNKISLSSGRLWKWGCKHFSIVNMFHQPCSYEATLLLGPVILLFFIRPRFFLILFHPFQAFLVLTGAQLVKLTKQEAKFELQMKTRQ